MQLSSLDISPDNANIPSFEQFNDQNVKQKQKTHTALKQMIFC